MLKLKSLKLSRISLGLIVEMILLKLRFSQETTGAGKFTLENCL